MLLLGRTVSHERLFKYLWAMFCAVQIEGAVDDNLVLNDIQRIPVGGKYNPLVLSLDGKYYDSVALLEQFYTSNTQKSLAQTLILLVLLYLKVNKFILANDT